MILTFNLLSLQNNEVYEVRGTHETRLKIIQVLGEQSLHEVHFKMLVSGENLALIR